jgi:hypothetical protein
MSSRKSHGEGRGNQEYQGVPNPQTIGKHIHEYVPVLDLPDDSGDDGTFTVRDLARHDGSDLEPGEPSGRHLLQQMELQGLLQVVSEGDGDTAARYAWREPGRQAVEDYLAEMDTLPCGCRTHIPDARDDPDGVITCGYCGEAYDRERFKELVRDL